MFVIGRDVITSLLLDGSASDPGEQEVLPNLTLRAEAFTITDDLCALVHNACGPVVKTWFLDKIGQSI